jgi:hypothetical protein
MPRTENTSTAIANPEISQFGRVRLSQQLQLITRMNTCMDLSNLALWLDLIHSVAPQCKNFASSCMHVYPM